MKAYNFISELVLGIKDADTKFTVWDEYNDKAIQRFSVDFSYVDKSKKKIHLGTTVADDPSYKYLDTLQSLKEWFNKNKIEKDYSVEFASFDDELWFNMMVTNGNVIRLINY